MFKGEHFFDVIFASSNGTMPVNDHWFEEARQIEIFGSPVRIVGPTELIWSKAFIQIRHRYDGADVVARHPEGSTSRSTGSGCSPTWSCIGRCC